MSSTTTRWSARVADFASAFHRRVGRRGYGDDEDEPSDYVRSAVLYACPLLLRHAVLRGEDCGHSARLLRYRAVLEPLERGVSAQLLLDLVPQLVPARLKIAL